MKNRMNFFALLLTLHTLCGAMQTASRELTQEEARKIYVEAIALINNNGDLREAEIMLRSIRDKFRMANQALVVLAVKEYNTNQTDDAAKKIIMYGLEAVEHGYNGSYNDIGVGYEHLGIYTKAREYYEKALPYDSAEKQAYVNLGILFAKGLGGEIDYKKAVDLYKVALKADNNDAIYYLGIAYFSGQGVTRAPQEALKLFSRVIDDPSNNHYANACVDLGLMYEAKMLKEVPGETHLKTATRYFTLAKETGSIRGAMHMARLIWTDKLEGDKEQAKKDLKKCADDGEEHALFLYSAILINEGDIEEGIRSLTDRYQYPVGAMPIMTRLQLALAYQDGWGGLQENKNLAQQYFTFIYDSHTEVYPFRSTFLAHAYMYIMGLGQEASVDRFKRMDEGFRLLEESKNQFDDVFLDTYALFPALKKIEEDYYNEKAALQNKLIEEAEQEEEKEKAKLQKQKGKAKIPALAPSKQSTTSKGGTLGAPTTSTTGGSSSKVSTVQAQTRNIVDVPISDWNDFWAKDGDGSTVSKVNKQTKKITIDDPQRNEQLIVTIDPTPYLNFDDLTELVYDPRVLKRQQNDIATGSKSHTFAKILDYVIQCAGKLGQFAKDASDEPKNQIIANVTRIDKTTKRETRCKAEYTFYQGKNDKRQHLYHRLLRPIRN